MQNFTETSADKCKTRTCKR